MSVVKYQAMDGDYQAIERAQRVQAMLEKSARLNGVDPKTQAVLAKKLVDYGIQPREFEALNMMMLGYSVVEIAKKMGISDATVVFHIKRLVKKVRAKNRVQLIAILFGFGVGTTVRPDTDSE